MIFAFSTNSVIENKQVIKNFIFYFMPCLNYMKSVILTWYMLICGRNVFKDKTEKSILLVNRQWLMGSLFFGVTSPIFDFQTVHPALPALRRNCHRLRTETEELKNGLNLTTTLRPRGWMIKILCVYDDHVNFGYWSALNVTTIFVILIIFFMNGALKITWPAKF